MTPGRCCRAVRAAMFAATCVLLAALGHVFMSAAPVPWWVLISALAATGAPAWLLAGRERGLAAVTSAAVAAQAALHAGFSLAQATAAQASTRAAAHTSPPPGSGHAHHDMAGMADMADVADMADATGTMSGPGGMPTTGMLAAHLLAALLCGLWLAYGEQGAFRVLRAVAGWLLVPLRLAFRLAEPAHRPRVRPRGDRRGRPPRRLLLVHAVTSRGPPSGTAVI
ncbi:hypothetical protein [Streptomyces sp. NPDC060031]|uniref:hypothetical protein n=1 Tax=Streptomyces sp. NPDC060031 TaxID=3347043 RepID=UPI0036A65255